MDFLPPVCPGGPVLEHSSYLIRRALLSNLDCLEPRLRKQHPPPLSFENCKIAPQLPKTVKRRKMQETDYYA